MMKRALFPGIPANTSGAGEIRQSMYDDAAKTGVEALKVDFGWYGATTNGHSRNWQYRPKDWPDGFDFRSIFRLILVCFWTDFGLFLDRNKSHAAGLKSSLYMGGSYHDVNLSTVAGRDVELQAILERYDACWFDMWRTDTFNAPENPLPDSFAGVTNFLHILDSLIGTRPGFRYENCANGGHFKGLSLARRFTFVTTNDAAGQFSMQES